MKNDYLAVGVFLLYELFCGIFTTIMFHFLALAGYAAGIASLVASCLYGSMLFITVGRRKE